MSFERSQNFNLVVTQRSISTLSSFEGCLRITTQIHESQICFSTYWLIGRIAISLHEILKKYEEDFFVGLDLISCKYIFTLNAQTPVVPAVSSGTLESLGFDQTEIDAIMETTGTSTSTAVESATMIQDAQQSAVDAANSQINTLAPNTSVIASPAVQEAIAEVIGDEPAPAPIWGQDFFAAVR